MHQDPLATDVFIAGGGMVGLTLALALAQGGLTVVVSDPVTPEEAAKEAFDGRVSALAFATTRMFRALGLWRALESAAQPINDIVVSDGRLDGAPSLFSLHFDHREIGEPLGHIVENRDIRRALFDAIRLESRVRLLSGVATRTVRCDGGSAVATLSDGRRVTALIAVAADGRDSVLREQLGIRSVAWEYGQNGIVTTVAHDRPHGGVAYEHFLPGGPFAILPMTKDRSSLVWTEPTGNAATLMAASPADFTTEIMRRFGNQLGRAEPVGPRWSYPLRLHLAREYVRPRFALIGDAAHAIHPLAGQGYNLGLKDVAALAETVLDAARLGLDYGALDILKRYERWRRFDSFVLAAATDMLNRLFSNDIAPLRLARDAGMGVVDRIAPLRRFFMRHAGGDIGVLPRLLRGEAA